MSSPQVLQLLPQPEPGAVPLPQAEADAAVSAVEVARRPQADSAAEEVAEVPQPAVSVVEAHQHREHCPCSPGRPKSLQP
jgi:hypothetical protein